MDEPRIVLDFENQTIKTKDGESFRFVSKDRMVGVARLLIRETDVRVKGYRPRPLKNPKTGKAFAWK